MDPLSELLTSNCKRLREEKKWKSESKIIGEAVEDCIVILPCPICGEKGLVKYKSNEKSKDIKCYKCSSQIQIKASKRKSFRGLALKLLGAEYKTTLLSITNNIHYIVLFYSLKDAIYKINHLYFINSIDITESCIIPRKPLSSTAKRAGWQGCTLVFNKFKELTY
jgi:type II restriction enzyme